MEEIFLIALAKRAEKDSTLLEKLDGEVAAKVQEKLDELTEPAEME